MPPATPTPPDPVPATPRALGFLGLAPQTALLLVCIVGDPRYIFAAQSIAFAYAALILSFLGGLWWGLAAASRLRVPAWVWIAAVMPSLFALACFLPWALAGDWPGPSLALLAIGIMASLAVDMRLVQLGLAPPWWLRLRLPLSLGLGAMTLAIGLLSARP